MFTREKGLDFSISQEIYLKFPMTDAYFIDKYQFTDICVC